MNSELLREAVGYADGWDWIDTKGKWAIWAPWNDAAYASVGEHIESQWVLDALAAQLVRQVDAMEDYWFDSDLYGTAKVWGGVEPGQKMRVAKANGPNRDENSIIACTEFFRGRKDE